MCTYVLHRPLLTPRVIDAPLSQLSYIDVIQVLVCLALYHFPDPLVPEEERLWSFLSSVLHDRPLLTSLDIKDGRSGISSVPAHRRRSSM
jgi:hypothetical protein